MQRLTPYTDLVLESVQEINRKHAIAGWYDVRYLIKWLQSKHKPELKALYDAYRVRTIARTSSTNSRNVAITSAL
jgi:hypothetical protein